MDGRKKPQPVISKTWLQSKAETYFITDSLARAAAGGEPPPFNDTLDKLSKLKRVKIDKASIIVKDGDVIFKVTAPDDDDKEVTIWVRAHANKEAVSQLLEKRLLAGYDDVQKKDKPSSEEEKQTSEPELIPISSQTMAKFSTDKSMIEKSSS